jgi:twitching motility protein PilT
MDLAFDCRVNPHILKRVRIEGSQRPPIRLEGPMGEQNQRVLLGRIAVQAKLITMDQLAEATDQQGREGGVKNIGQILIERGLITPQQLQKLVKVQKDYLAKLQAKKDAAAAAPPPPATGAFAPRDASTPKGPSTSGVAAATATAVAPAAVATPRAAVSGATQQTVAIAGRTITGRLDAFLTRGVELGASDIHVHSGTPLTMRIHGRLVQQGEETLSREEAETLLLEILSPDQRQIWEERGEIDFAHTIPNVGRFRANVFRQQRGVDGVFRAIPPTPPTLQELGLPSILAKFTNFHQGIVLVTGPGGCGKSSTLAALLNMINEERREHILTIEDPIEYLHPSKRCVLNQRQVVRHTESFARALRAALREDPDVIAIGELRDLETISLALTAAETGHLVLATLHTNNTIRTINRLVGVFPPNQQSQIRTMISESLRAIVSQRLVATADGKGRVAAVEILVINKAVGNLIRENKTFQIRSVLQTGGAQGMCLLDSSLVELVKAGTISKDEALRNCEDARRFS